MKKKLNPILDDPIYNYMCKVSIPFLWLTIVIVNIVLYLTLGLIIDHRYHGAKDLLSAFSPAELVNGFNVWILFNPIVWVYYRWFPEAALRSCKKLEDLGIIMSKIKKKSLSSILHQRLSAKWIHLVAILFTTFSILYTHLVWQPYQFQQLHVISYLYYTKWSLVLFILAQIPIFYVFFSLLFRLFIVLITLNGFFKQPNSIISLYPFHPDKCGGTGELGVFISKIILIAMLLPIWITVSAYVMPILAKGNSQICSAPRLLDKS